MDAQFARQFRTLRSRIETTLPEHAVIAVTSALPGDGTSMTAAGLAGALKGAGYRCVLVDARGENAPEEPAITYDFRLTPPIGMTISRGFAVSALRQLRAEADFIVVDTPSAADGTALLVCSAADAVLVTVRSGRRQTETDAHLAKSLESAGSNVLGIVLVANDSTDQPEKKHESTRNADVTELTPKKVSSIVHG